MGEAAVKILEGIAAGGLEGLAAAGFYICFFRSGRGAALAGTGIGILVFAAFQTSDWLPGMLVLSAVWMMLTGGIYRTRQWKELFLAGGLWLFVRSLAGLWPDSGVLQTVSALALFGMTALYLLSRERLYPLWMGTLVCLWLLDGFFKGMVYGEDWQVQVMKAAEYLVLGGIIGFQQVFCICQEMKRIILEENGEYEERREEQLAGQSGRKKRGKLLERESVFLDGESKDWQKAADREVRRLRIFEHDFRHHLDMLGALYEEGSPEEARVYLEDLKQARYSGQGQREGGEKTLSYIMMAKRQACRKAGIQFSSQILGSPRGIAQMDMTALLLNLLDNAIRACEKGPEPRSIGIMLLARGELWQIELENTGFYDAGGAEKREKQWENSRFQDKEKGWRKQEKAESGEAGYGGRKQLHGIGLFSVRQIVEKYQGVFEIRQEGDKVVQKLILTGQLPE